MCIYEPRLGGVSNSVSVPSLVLIKPQHHLPMGKRQIHPGKQAAQSPAQNRVAAGPAPDARAAALLHPCSSPGCRLALRLAPAL